MKKTFLLMTTAFLLPLMAGAQSPAAAPAAQPAATAKAPTAPATAPQHHEMTLEEARKHAHEMADKLDKMTPDEWRVHQAKKKAFWDKVNKMSPEERDKFFKERHERMEKWRQMTPAQRDAAKAGHDMHDGVPEIPGGHE